jgi:hypothetical protein
MARRTGDFQVKYPGHAHVGLFPGGSTHGVKIPQIDRYSYPTFEGTPLPSSRSCKTADQEVWGLVG